MRQNDWLKRCLWLLILLLAACDSTDSSSPTSTPTLPLAASVQFLEGPTDLGGTAWMEDQALEFGIELGFGGVYALDHSTAFLYGGAWVPAGMLHSILLRSADGGHHWQEVMERVPASDIWFIDFVDHNQGWALAVWTVEGPGPLMLYHTADGGLTWTRLGEVPKWQWYGYPLNMDFSDALHGQIDMMYDLGLPSDNRVAYLTTADGGVTWLESSSLPLGLDKNGMASATVVSGYETRRLKSTAPDGSTWELETPEGAGQVLIRCQFEKTVQTYTFPVKYSRISLN